MAAVALITSVTVEGFTDLQGFTEYRICTLLNRGCGYAKAAHRLTAFDELHRTLCPQLAPPGLAELSGFGMRIPYALHTPRLKEQRRLRLEAYLKALVALAKDGGCRAQVDASRLPHHDRTLCEFLGIDEEDWAVAEPAAAAEATSSPAFQSADLAASPHAHGASPPLPASLPSPTAVPTAAVPAAAVPVEVRPRPVEAAPLVLSAEEGEGRWTLTSWARGAGVHRAVGAALEAALGGRSEGSTFDALVALESEEELYGLLDTPRLTSCLAGMLWGELLTLREASAPSAEELASKFAGSIELSYSGLDTFFGGLEGVVGPPNPKVSDGLLRDHTKGGSTESADWFTTGNYGVRTSSQIEWHYVVNAEATPAQFGLPLWPAESDSMCCDRSRCRKREALDSVMARAAPRNEQLKAFNQPKVVLDEVISARLYTGPMFVKYNAVLRGLGSESPFLSNTMIMLCCPAAVVTEYMGTTSRSTPFLPAAGSMSFEGAQQSLNKYTTTLHCINSAIVKLGKLTHATKVFRGIAGMKLPQEFWTPNAFGVRGGVEHVERTRTHRACAVTPSSFLSNGTPQVTHAHARAQIPSSGRRSCQQRQSSRWRWAMPRGGVAPASSSRSSKEWSTAAPTFRSSPSTPTSVKSYSAP